MSSSKVDYTADIPVFETFRSTRTSPKLGDLGLAEKVNARTLEGACLLASRAVIYNVKYWDIREAKRVFLRLLRASSPRGECLTAAPNQVPAKIVLLGIT